MNAKEDGATSFETEMVTEIDGIANGPFLGSVQMIPSLARKYLAILRSGGATFEKGVGDTGAYLAKDRSLDPYMIGGQAWAETTQDRLNTLFTRWKEAQKNGDTKAIAFKTEWSRMKAVNRIIGDFSSEDGTLAKSLRKLIKNPIMTTIYGSGKESLEAAVGQEVIDTIYKKMESIAEMGTEAEARAALTQLFNDINILGNLAPNSKHAMRVPAKLTRTNILEISMDKYLTQRIMDHVGQNHGKALNSAIAISYGGIMESRKVYNDGFALLTGYYNAFRNVLIEARKEELKSKGKLPVVRILKGKEVYADLSVEDYRDIEDRLKGLIPAITSPFGTKVNMNKGDRFKSYSEATAIDQKVNKSDTLPTSTNRAQIPLVGGLESPGVSPAVLSTQLMDSVIANRLYGEDYGCLGCHDGFYVSFEDAEAVNGKLNEHTLNLLKNYDLAQKMADSILAGLSEVNAIRSSIMKKTGTSSGDIQAAVEEAMADMQYKVFNKAYKQLVVEHEVEQNDAEPTIDEVVARTKELINAQTPVITAAKNAVVANMENLNHYYYPDAGFNNPDVLAEKDEAFTDLDSRTAQATDEAIAELMEQKNVEANIDVVIQAFLKELGRLSKGLNKGRADTDFWNDPPITFSSKYRGAATTALNSSLDAEGLSTDTKLYDLKRKVDRMNVVEVYDELQAMSHVAPTTEHNTRLKKLLGATLNKVLNPVDLYLKEDAAKETHGKILTAQRKIFLSNQGVGAIPPSGALAHGLRMSTGEAYAHEIVHAITHVGLGSNSRLRNQVAELFKLAKKELDYTAFLNDPGMDVNDPANVHEVKAAQDRYDYIFNNAPVEGGISAHLDEFLAFGTTNGQFVEALLKISTDKPSFNRSAWAGIKGDTIQQTLVNIYNKIMDYFLHTFATEKPAANVALELERLALRLGQIDTRQKGKIFEHVSKISSVQAKMNQFMNDWIKKTFQATIPYKGVKKIASMAMEQDNEIGKQMRRLRLFLDRMDMGFGKAIVREINGLTDRLFQLHELLNFRKTNLDQAREAATETIIQKLEGAWETPLTDEQKVSLFKAGIKTDLSSLLDSMPLAEIKQLLNDNKSIETAITALENELAVDNNLNPYLHYYTRQARSLGYYLVHGRALEPVTFFNAGVIAKLANTHYSGLVSTADAQKAEGIIDQLATLYALQFSTEQHKKDLADLITRESDSVASVLELHRQIKEEAARDLFPSGSNKIMKGYVVDITNPETLIEVAPLDKKEELEAKEYVMHSKVLKDSKDKGPDLYMFVAKHGQRNDLSSGIMSMTANKPKGTTRNFVRPSKHLSDEDLTPQERVDLTVVANKEDELNSMFKPLVNKAIPKNLPTYMVPKVDDSGEITAYRYTMAEHVKDSVLEKHNHYDAVLGRMAGQTVDKRVTGHVNRELFKALKTIYDNEYKNRPTNFVAISPMSDSPRLREIYHQFPDSAHAQLKEIWGAGQALMVPKDVVDLAFGQRKYSIRETLLKDKEEARLLEGMIIGLAQAFFGNKKITRMKQIEDILSELTKTAKNIIIVKSFVVTMHNAISNYLFTKMNGVPFHKSFKWQREAFSGAIQYQNDARKLKIAKLNLELNQRRAIGTSGMTKGQLTKEANKLRDEIRHLNNELVRNPVHVVMQAGLLQSIVDDVETSKGKSPFPGVMERMTNKLESKLPSLINKVGKVALMAEDTQAYKLLNNAVAMTDFVGRYIMYRHYMEQAHKAGKKPADVQRQIVAKVMHQFINFNLPES